VSTQRTGELLALLQDAGVELVVVGGVAAIAHGATRSTRDLDVVAPFTPENLERLLRALRPHAVRHVLRPDLGPLSQTAEQLVTQRLLLLTCELGRVDVLREVPPVGAHEAVESVEMEIVPGRRFRVISLDQLIEIKAALTRPQDEDVERDLRAIRALREEAERRGD
jgi:predicted nucleotidyltransferase